MFSETETELLPGAGLSVASAEFYSVMQRIIKPVTFILDD